MPFAAYHRLLTARPLLTKSITSGVLAGLGDIISQSIENTISPKPYSLKRTLVMTSFGTFAAGPALHCWYAKVLARVFPNPSLKENICKIAMDQTLFTAAFLSGFFYYMTRMEGQSHTDGINKIKGHLVPILIDNWKLWVPVQLANFTFIPISYQVLAVNFVGLIWNVYLSHAQHKGS